MTADFIRVVCVCVFLTAADEYGRKYYWNRVTNDSVWAKVWSVRVL